MTKQTKLQERKAEIAAMTRKELNGHAFLLEQEQEEYEATIKRLTEENELLRTMEQCQSLKLKGAIKQNEMHRMPR